MKFGKIIVCLAGGLVLATGLRADDLALNSAPLPDNPYATIVTRNVFGLNPPVVDTNPAVELGLPKITPNGIMSVFGKFQVLYKVTPAGKSGQKDEYYTLSEGEAQDEIEVMHIDDQNGIITFKNHGTVQELPLVVASSTGGGAPSPMTGNPGFNQPNGNNGDNQGGPGNRIMRFGNRGGGPGGFNRRGQNNQDSNGAAAGNGDSLNLRTIPTRTYQPPASQMTPEESAINIEQQRAQALDNGDPKANLFPPTPLTGKY